MLDACRCQPVATATENQAIYPQQRSQKAGLGFPICRIVGVMCLASGGILNAVIGPFSGKGASEQTLLRRMLDTFKAGDIVLGDGFYASHFLLAALLDRYNRHSLILLKKHVVVGT